MTGLGPMPGGEVLEVGFGVQKRLFRRQEERGIRRVPVHIGKRILAQVGQIPDHRPPATPPQASRKRQIIRNRRMAPPFSRLPQVRRNGDGTEDSL